jgi:hypothetical protein
MVLYNYFREKWLVDRLANTAAEVFGHEPLGHVHQDRAYLAVMLAGPRVADLAAPPALPADVNAYGQPHDPSPAHSLTPDASVVLATDDWPFLYMQSPALPRHYLAALGIVLVVSALAVWLVLRGGTGISGLAAGPPPRWSWHFFFLGAGFMLLETKSIVQFALLWGSTWSSASLAIASVLVMALASALIVSRVEIESRRLIGAALLTLIAVNYFIPVGRVRFDSRAAESLFYGVLVFSPVFCAGLLFSSSFKESSSTASDFGANLLGAIVGGVGEYLSLLAGYRFVLILVAGCYVLAMVTREMTEGTGTEDTEGTGTEDTEGTGTESTEGTGSHRATKKRRKATEKNFSSLFFLRCSVALCDPILCCLRPFRPLPAAAAATATTRITSPQGRSSR